MTEDGMRTAEMLLVEDLAEDAELSTRALKKHNLLQRVKWVTDGEEALEFLFGEGRYAGRDVRVQPRLVLLDIKLPKLNGIEVLKAIRANPDCRKLPVVMMTSSKEASDIEAAYELGCNSYVVKPVAFSNFSDLVRNVGNYWLNVNESP